MELAVYGRPRAKQAVLNLLNDPDSAQFRHVVFSRFENGAAVFCGAVNARNSFGGYAPFRAFYAVGDWAPIEEDTDSWGIGFRRQCGDVKVGAKRRLSGSYSALIIANQDRQIGCCRLNRSQIKAAPLSTIAQLISTPDELWQIAVTRW